MMMSSGEIHKDNLNTSSKAKNNLRKRTFRFTGTVYFNDLPDEVKHLCSLSTFKSLVYRHFLNQ